MKRNFTCPAPFAMSWRMPAIAGRHSFFLNIFFLMLLSGISINSFAQPTVLGTEIVNGGYVTYNLNTVGGFKQVRIQALNNGASGLLKWEFCRGAVGSEDYTTNWRPYTVGQTLSAYNVFIDPATATASARYNTGSGGQGGLLPAVTAGNYYTFNVTTNAAANNNMAVHETTYNPETISTVTQSPVTVGAIVSPVITITTSVAPQANIYVRYSTSSTFATSTIVQASFVGTTGTATIPAQTAGTTIYYYVYSSTRTKAAIDADVTTYGQNVHDMATLNLNNNAGANYSYLVLPVTVNATNAANDASYTTLKAAFDAINLGTHTGTINVWIGGNTTEAASAVLNASGAPSSYTSVTVKSSGLRTVTGNIAGPLVDLNGADNVTIDGLNDGTNTLTFTNSSTSAVAGTSTIRMYNGTLVNALQNCIIEGSTLSTADGIVSLGSGTNTTISVTGNTIRPAAGNLPVYGVYSSGTNTSVTVSTNNIQDYFSATVNSAGVYANTACNSWTVSNNKFYQTASRTVTTLGVVVRAIQVTAGGGHTISNNTIGFANNAGTGTTTYITTTTTNQVIPIEIGGTVLSSSIQGNIISGISITSASNLTSTTAPGIFSGIYVSSGAANIGTATGNTIGATTGTGSISITCSVTGTLLFVSGIYATSLSPNVVNIQNNTVGSINLAAASAAVLFQFYGICVPVGATANFTVADNQVGSTTTANSIVVGASSTGGAIFGGIVCATTGTVSIPGNIIQNISLAATGASNLGGISVGSSTGVLSITNNSIISCTNGGTGAFVPIGTSSVVTTLNISGNIIRNHVITSGTTVFNGIFNTGAVTGAININNNQLGNASGGLVTYTIANNQNFTGISNAGGAATAVLTIQANDFRGVVNSVIGSGAHYYIYNSAATLSQNISTNTFTGLTSNINGSTFFIFNNVSLSATGTKIINDNSIVTSFTKLGAAGNIYFYFDAGASVAGATVTNDGNNFSNVTVTGSTPITGWFNTDGSGAVPTKNITNNIFNNLIGNTSLIYPMFITNGSGNISTNTITNCSTPAVFVGLTVTAGSFNIFSNNINTNTSTGTSVTGISISGGTTHNIYYHTIHTLSSPALAATVSAISVSGGTTVKVYKNKIYGLSNSAVLVSGGVQGIAVSGGTTVSVYNNLVGNLTAPAANFDDAIRGISVVGSPTANVYYNTVYLNASSTGANFGSSAMFGSTVSTIDLRNNILYNISTPGASGRTIAYRRNGASFVNYAATSDNNYFLAGTPGATRLIFYDGTTGYQTLVAYKAIAGLAPRDNLSVTSLSLPFISTVGSSLNFLHLSGANAASDAGASVGGVTDDYDDEARSGTTPDIGADEFSSAACPATPTITSLSAGPYYAGDPITITGTNLSGITYATINDINVTIGTTTAITAQLTIPVTMTDTVGVIQVAASSSCPFSGTFNFVYAGFITKGGQGAVNWGTNTIWKNNALPVNNAPAIINTGDVVTLNVAADPIKFTILAGANLIHQNNSLVFGTTYLNNTIVNGTLTIDNSGAPVLTSASRFISPTLVVKNGTFNNNCANAAAVTIANFYIDGGAFPGTYNHNAVGSTGAGVVNDFPGSTVRSYGATSNVVVTKWANGTAPGTGLPASGSPGWGNLTISVATLAGSWNQSGALTNVQGNLNITATGGGTNEFRLTGNTATTLTVAGNISISGGGFVGNSGSASPTITVSGNMNITGGYFTPCDNSGTTCTVNVTGNCVLNGGNITPPGSGRTYIMSMAALSVSSTSVFGLSSSSSSALTLTTGSIIISGDGSMGSTSSGPITINCTGNFSSTSTGAGAPATIANCAFAFFRSNTSGKAYILNLGGNFSVTGTGLFFGGSGSSPASINFTGGAASVTFTAAPSVMSVVTPTGCKNNFFVISGKTLTLNNSIIPASTSSSNSWTFTVNTGATLDFGTNSVGDPALTNRVFAFTAQTGATLRTGHAGGVYNLTPGLASINTTVANASLSSGATYVFNGSSAQVSSAFTTTPTASTVANMVINNAAGVTLSANYDVTAALQMQTGNLTLSTFNLTTASVTGSPFSNTKMVVTNSTGALGQPVALTTILYPVGNSGNYTPASYTFTFNSTPRYLNVRAVTPRNVNDVSATDYINNRWWNTDLSVASGSYSYTSVYTYISGDMVGTAANIRLNRWTGSAWVNDASSVVNNATFTITSGSLNETTGTLAATAQWVGRVYTAPAIYTWTNPVNGSWLDPTKWTPSGVPGSGDGVIFDKVGAYNVFRMPVGISLIQMHNTGSTLNLRSGAAGTVNITSAGVAPQFRVSAGASTTLDSLNAVNINLISGASGNVSGSLNLQKTTHTVTVTTAAALIIPSGGYFSYGSTSNTGFSGNPFGTTGTNGAVIFQNGSVCECFEGANPFGNLVTDKITTFQTNSLFRYSDPNVSLPSVSGRTYSNFEYNANKTSSLAASNSFICDSLTVTVGTFNLNLQGTPTPDHSIKGNIKVASGSTLSFTPAAAGTINMNSGATQIIWGPGIFNVNALATFDINAGTTVSLQKNMGVSSTGNVAINGTLIATGENYFSSPTAGGTVTMNTGSVLSVQSVDGISTTGIGNVRSTNFTYNAGSFIYSGTANQNTGNRLPATITGVGASLTIANTGTNPTDIVTLLPNNKTTPVLNLNSGRFDAGTGGELVIQAGTLNGNGGNQNLAGTASDNIIRFNGNGVINGTPELYNVWAGGGNVDFVNNARINNIFKINLLGAVVNHSPKYAVGSTLIYNNTGSYNRDFEWGSNVALAPSYPHHVIIQNGTTVNFTASTPAAVGCGGNLTIGSPSGAGAGTLNLSAAGAKNLYIGGDINIGGSTGASSLLMSNTIGGDIYLTGSWNRNSLGSVNFGAGNGRAIFFEGSTNATITANGGQTFPYVYITKSTPANKVTLNDNISITDEIGFTQGIFELAAKNTTLISTALKTSRVGRSNAANTNLLYSGTGRFIIERNVAALRSWRFLTAPINTAQTMRAAWMEGAVPSTTAPLFNSNPVLNYGTHISGPSPAANGFDETPQNNYSVKYYNGSAWIGTGIKPDTSNLIYQKGWMLFVRGDRNYPISTTLTSTPAQTTTLRITGKINIGTMPTITPSGFTPVGNPYASAVDFSSVTKAGPGDIYYIWDPRITSGTTSTTVGGWITMTRGAGTTYTAVPSPISPIDLTTGRIESGAAILVNSANITSLNFQETDKPVLNNNALVFRPQPAPVQLSSLRTNLHVKNNDGSLALFDGVMNMFDRTYSNSVDGADALKFTNFAENFSIAAKDKLLAIEKRNVLSVRDTIFFNLSQLKLRNYTFEFIAQDIVQHNLAGFLEDNFLRTKTPVNMDGSTMIDFTVTTTAGSYAKDRFRLVFRRSSKYASVNAAVVNNDIAVNWNLEDEVNISHYEIERSTDGTSFVKMGTVDSKGDTESAVNYKWLDASPALGEYYYRIKSISNNGVVGYSDIAKVKLVKGSPELYVFPNPVTDGIIQLQLNNALAGMYSVSLLGSNGQLIFSQQISHAGGTATKTIRPSQQLLTGTYQLKVTAPDNKVAVIKVVVGKN